jgi:hypothetical protein
MLSKVKLLRYLGRTTKMKKMARKSLRVQVVCIKMCNEDQSMKEHRVRRGNKMRYFIFLR